MNHNYLEMPISVLFWIQNMLCVLLVGAQTRLCDRASVILGDSRGTCHPLPKPSEECTDSLVLHLLLHLSVFIC